MRYGTGYAPLMTAPASVVPIAAEDRPAYDRRPGARDPIAVLTADDRDDVLRNLTDAEAALREVLPDLVLALNGTPGEEFLIRDTARAMTRLSGAIRTIEDRVAAGAPTVKPGEGPTLP